MALILAEERAQPKSGLQRLVVYTFVVKQERHKEVDAWMQRNPIHVMHTNLRSLVLA
jgi:hypothetical protein